MKRNKNLQPLSRQHHNALMAVLLLKKGVKKNASLPAMKSFVAMIWQDELRNHFSAEEELLATFNSKSTEANKLYVQMKSEHERLKQMIQSIQQDDITYYVVEQFYTALEKHIRFEERVYFPMIESMATTDELIQIGSIAAQMPETTCINFAEKFWD